MKTDTKIKVFNITEEGRGGGAMYRIAMVAKMCQVDLQTIVITPSAATNYNKKLQDQGTAYRTINMHPLTKELKGLVAYLLFFIPEIYALYRLIKQEKPDVIHANGSWQYKGIIAAKLTGTPSIWHMNDMWQPNIIKKVFHLFSGLPTSYIFASERTKNYYQSISPHISKKPNSIIPAPVDISKYTKQNRSLDTSKIKLVNVGYVNAHKGLETLMDIADVLDKDTYEFHIIGPVLESQKNYFSSLARLQEKAGVDNIRWHGFADDVPNRLSQMSIYLCTSLRESSPMAVWEALAAGLPIVSTDVGDVAQIVDRYDCGIVTPIEDHIALAEAIVSITGDPDIYTQRSANAIKAAQEEFSLNAVSNRYISFLNTQVNTPS